MANNYTNKLIKLSAQLYIGWVLFISLLTLVPGNLIPEIDWNFLSLDKIIHLSVFTVLTFLGSIFYKFGINKQVVIHPVIISFISAILYGTLLEYLQTFIPERSFDYADLTANILGSVMGSSIFLLSESKIK